MFNISSTHDLLFLGKATDSFRKYEERKNEQETNKQEASRILLMVSKNIHRRGQIYKNDFCLTFC